MSLTVIELSSIAFVRSQRVHRLPNPRRCPAERWHGFVRVRRARRP